MVGVVVFAKAGIGDSHRSDTLDYAGVSVLSVLELADSHRSDTLTGSAVLGTSRWNWPTVTAQIHSVPGVRCCTASWNWPLLKFVRNIEWHGWHAFRRGLATNLHRLGVPDKVIQVILRHASVSVTQQCYIKTADPDAVSAMRKLEDATKMQLQRESAVPARWQLVTQ